MFAASTDYVLGKLSENVTLVKMETLGYTIMHEYVVLHKFLIMHV